MKSSQFSNLQFLSYVDAYKPQASSLNWRFDGLALVICHNDDSLVVVERNELDYWTTAEYNLRKYGCDQAIWYYFNSDTEFSTSTKLLFILSAYARQSHSFLYLFNSATSAILYEFKLPGKALRGSSVKVYKNKVLVTLTNGDTCVLNIEVNKSINSSNRKEEYSVSAELATILNYSNEMNVVFQNDLIWHRHFVPVCDVSVDGVLWISVDTSTLHCFLLENLDNGPSHQIQLTLRKSNDFIRTIKISNFGNLLVSTALGEIKLISGKNGILLWQSSLPLAINEPIVCLSPVLKRYECSSSLAFHLIGSGLPDICPEERFVICGILHENKGQIVIYDIVENTQTSIGKEVDIPFFLIFNPSLNLIADSSPSTKLWSINKKPQ